MASEIRTGVGQREQRFIGATTANVEIRAAAGADPVIEGHGALFNDETVIGGMFRERILPGAFTESIAQDDIRVAFNHNANYILGRTTAKTATVAEDAKGLKYTAIPPDTQAGRDTVTSIKRGDITGSSFQFEIERDEDETWDFTPTKDGKLPLRTIKRAKVWEVGPVAWPAYEHTTVSARAVAQVEEARAALAAAAEANDTCVACKGSGLNPERQMSDPKGQVPCETCSGSGKRTAAAPAVPDPVASEERAAGSDVDALEEELNRLEFEG